MKKLKEIVRDKIIKNKLKEISEERKTANKIMDEQKGDKAVLYITRKRDEEIHRVDLTMSEFENTKPKRTFISSIFTRKRR